MKQVQRALRERNECTRAPPKIMPVSCELNSLAHDLHIANNAQLLAHIFIVHKGKLFRICAGELGYPSTWFDNKFTRTSEPLL